MFHSSSPSGHRLPTSERRPTPTERRLSSSCLARPTVQPTRYEHKPPVRVPRVSRSQYPFLLMHDCRGWANRATSPLQNAYLAHHGVPECGVPKGTLVDLDPQYLTAGNLDHNPLAVVSLDLDHSPGEEICITVLMKELMPIEPEVSLRLFPLSPAQRFKLLTDDICFPILTAQVGDTVWYCPKFDRCDVGMIQYIGPVQGLAHGHWYGVELLDPNQGSSDGSFGSRQYFSAAKGSSVFVSANEIIPYQNQASLSRRKKTGMPTQGRDPPPRMYSQPYNSEKYAEPKWAQADVPEPPRPSNQASQDQASSVIHSEALLNESGPQVSLHDRVVCFRDNRDPEHGFVRWIGHIPGERNYLAGVEFDEPVGATDGTFHKKRLFRTRKKHASLLPLDSLMRAKDFQPSPNTQDRHSQSANSFLRNDVRSTELEFSSSYDRRKSTRPSSSNSQTGSKTMSSRRSHGTTNDRFTPPCSSHELSPTDFSQSCSLDRRKKTDSHFESTKHSRSGGANVKSHGTPKSESPRQFGTPSPPDLEDSLIFDRLSAVDTERNQEVEAGSLVELKINDISFFGVVRWSGWLPNEDSHGIGIELEEDMTGATNGWHQGSQLFACPERKAVFVPYTHFMLDQRFRPPVPDQSSLGSWEQKDFGDTECPIVPGFHEPIQVPSGDIVRVCGRNRGIQGHQNSCYLDATLFAMFSFTSVFDSLLYRPQTTHDISEYCKVQKVLREEIVNPLRKNLFVRADRVMKLRKFLDHLTSVRGLTTEEKDPEEFLNSLLSQTLKVPPFLQLSSGQDSHLYQLFVERKESLVLPTVQELFEQSIITSNVKLKRVPSVLILQMPRFGSQFKVYSRIIPSQLLDITDIIENSPRQCAVCGQLALQECQDCYGDLSPGLESTAFCDNCLSRVHNHQERQHHSPKPLRVPQEYCGSRLDSEPTPRVFMELFAVVCIETSHYVSFVKCGLGPDAQWCFFDSMADREGECNGYNIPEVTPAVDVPRWLSDEGTESLRAQKDDKLLPTQAKRLICDAYMCFYQSPEVMMYQ